MMKRIVAIIALTLLCAGCNNPQSFGIGPWPVYTEPAPIAFSPEEQAELQSFAKDHAAVFKKIQAQEHSYRALIQEHNARAKAMNRKQLQTLGFDDDTLKQTLSE